LGKRRRKKKVCEEREAEKWKKENAYKKKGDEGSEV
jgi:hypothetical protein